MMLPTLFVLGAAFFAVTTVTRSMMWTYVGVVALPDRRSGAHGAVPEAAMSTSSASGSRSAWARSAETVNTGRRPSATPWCRHRRRMPGQPAHLAGRRRSSLLGLAYVALPLPDAAAAPAGQGPSRSRTPWSSAPAPARCRPALRRRAACAQLWAWTALEMGQVFKSPAYFVLLGLAAAARWATSGSRRAATTGPIYRSPG